MKKRIHSFLATVLAAAALSVFFCLPAYAQTDSVTVRVEKGDTVYGLCQELGLSYNLCKSAIMSLNGFTRESQLGNIKAGSDMLFPAAESETNKVPVLAGDSVAFYLMTYKFKEGDYLYGIYNLWGLDYDDYAADVLYLNDIPDPDKIPIGRLLRLPTNEENLMGNDYTTVVGHVMASGESVYEVCRSYGLDYYAMEDRLTEFNTGRDLTKIQAGQTLKIPFG